MRALCGRVGDVCADACACTCVVGGGEGGGSEGGGGEGCGGAVATVFGRRGWCVFGRVCVCARVALVRVGDGGGDALDVRCDVRGARAYAVRASCVTLTSCVLCARGVRALCLWRTCIAEVAAAEIACVAGALRL